MMNVQIIHSEGFKHDIYQIPRLKQGKKLAQSKTSGSPKLPVKLTLQDWGNCNPASSQPPFVICGHDLTSRYSSDSHFSNTIPIPATLIFGQLLTFKTFKVRVRVSSTSAPFKPWKAASVTSSQHPMSRASRLLHWARMQLKEESVIFRHQSILKFLRLVWQEEASNFIDESEMSRQPPMIRVSRFLQNLAKDIIDSSPTL